MESNPYLVGDEPTQEVEDEVSPFCVFFYRRILLGTLNLIHGIHAGQYVCVYSE